MHDQVRQINVFPGFSLQKKLSEKEQLATWLIDDRQIHLQTNLFFSIKFIINLSATIRNIYVFKDTV